MRLPTLLAAVLLAARLPAADPPAVALNWRAMDGTLERYVQTVAFSADGRRVAAGAQDTILVWDAGTGKPVTRMRLPDRQDYHDLAFTADGTQLVSNGRDRVVRFWDLKTGKQTREWGPPLLPIPGVKNPVWSRFKAFGPGAALVALDGYRQNAGGYVNLHGVDLVDLATGRTKVEIPANHLSSSGTAFTRDGQILATDGDFDAVELWATATGKRVRQIRPADPTRQGAHPRYARFSPDETYLLTADHTGRIEVFDKYKLVVWGVADSKKYAEFPDYSAGFLSADNRCLLVGSGFVIDLWTGGKVAVAGAPPTPRRLVNASPDGKRLAFVGEAVGGPNPGLGVYLADAPVLAEPIPPNADLSADDLGLLWAGWASDSEFRRRYAWKLVSAHRDRTVAYAADQLRAVPALDGRRTADLVETLDDDDPDVRDKATAHLQEAVYEFEPLIAAAAKAAGPGEVRNRVAVAVRWAKEAPPPAAFTARVRGVALVERLGTPAARSVLERLAAGATGARLTEDAKAALGRLAAKTR